MGAYNFLSFCNYAIQAGMGEEGRKGRTHAQRLDEEGTYRMLLQHRILASLFGAVLVEILAVQQAQCLLTHMHSPCGSSSLQSIGNVNILGPDIKLPLGGANYAGQHVARVHANAHIDVQVSFLSHIAYILDHTQSQIHTALGMILVGTGQSRHAVVAIAQELNAHHIVLLAGNVEAHEEIMQCLHQLLYIQRRSQMRVVHHIRVEHRHILVRLNEECAEKGEQLVGSKLFPMLNSPVIWLPPSFQCLSTAVHTLITPGVLMLLLGALNTIPHILLQSIRDLCGKNTQQQATFLISCIAQQEVLLHILTSIEEGRTQRYVPHQAKEHAQYIDAAQIDCLAEEGGRK